MKLKNFLNKTSLNQLLLHLSGIPFGLCSEEEVDARSCVDLLKANTTIIKNYYSVPTFDEILYKVNGTKIFSKLGLVQVFSPNVGKHEPE